MLKLQGNNGKIHLRNEKVESRILHTGDCCPLGGYEALFCSGEIENVLSDFIALSRSYDAHVTNLETPLSAGGQPIVKCGPNFRASPKVANGLRKLGVTHACLANNHIKDYGPDPIEETIVNLREANIVPVGAVDLAEAVARPVYIEKDGVTVALINVAEAEFAYPRDGEWGASCLNEGELMLKIREARKNAHAVMVRAHAGREHAVFPATWLRNLFQRLIDAGADIVAADHPHIPQGVEIRGDGLIFYSMGNFVFDYHDAQQLPGSLIGYAVGCGFSKDGLVEAEIIPYVKKAELRVQLIPDKETRDFFFAFLSKLSEPLADDTTAEAIWDEYIRDDGAKYMKSLKNLFSDLNVENIASSEKLFPMFSGLLNSCRTHREISRAFIRLMYEGRLESDPIAAATIKSAKDLVTRVVEKSR